MPSQATEISLAALPLFIIATFSIWVLSYQSPEQELLNPHSSLIRHFIHNGIKGDMPAAPKQDNGFDQELLKAGDLIFGHNPGSSYGYWSHCAIYLGNGECTQQNLSEGMSIAPNTDDFRHYYKEVKIFRAPINEEQRQLICDFARSCSGKIFDMAARKRDPRLWTCAKVCWAAYEACDIDLSPHGSYVLPDFLVTHPALDEIAHFSTSYTNTDQTNESSDSTEDSDVFTR